MSDQLKRLGRVMSSLVLALSGTALAFNSGSTGADGAFSPTVSTQVQLPESGIFNFSTVNIPSGVTVTFKRNTANTPVVILATGDVTIAGTIDVSGSNAANAGASGDGNLGDDGIPGRGGPGGQDGGRGGAAGAAETSRGGNGLGPGGGSAGALVDGNTTDYWCRGLQVTGGGGGGFGGEGANARSFNNADTTYSRGGAPYGSSQLLPLSGGSGGGGGGGYSSFGGSGGGGGGGAILIASSGTLNVTGSILASGGASGANAGPYSGGTGGGGSGGAIRLLATIISGNGMLSAEAGAAKAAANECFNGGNGAVGRIRLEAETFTRTQDSKPPFPAVTAPTTVFVAGLPTLRITSVAGVSAPAVPTGNADIVLPANTQNPVTVTFATTGVPVGNIVTLTVVPAAAASVSAVSTALSGSTDNATSSANITLPSGPSVLQATTSYTVVAALGRELGTRYANGEQVERVTLVASIQGPPAVMLTTKSGKEFRITSLARD